MTDTLYRWVKAVERLPQIAAHLPVRIEGDYYLAYFEACDMGDYYIFSCFDNHDRRIDTDENRDMVEWLEPIPSLDIDKVVDAEKVLDFLLRQSDLNIIDMNDGCFYWREDKDGDQPLEPKDIIELYRKELLNQSK